MKVWALTVYNVKDNDFPSLFSSKEKAIVGSKEYYQKVIKEIEKWEINIYYDAKFNEKTGNWYVGYETEDRRIVIIGQIYTIEVR